MQRHPFSDDIKTRIKTLCRYDNHHGLFALLRDYGTIAAAVALAQAWPWCYPLAVIVIGARQRALATLLHEAAHRTLAAHRGLNRALGTWLSGYLVFQTWDAYVRSHVSRHHPRLGDPAHDPDLRYHLDVGLYAPQERASFIRRQLIRPLLCLNAVSTVGYLLRDRLLGTDRRELPKMLLALLVFAGIGSACVGWQFFLLYWLVPYLTAFQVITWFIELSEHYPLMADARDDLHGSRNRFSHPLEAWLTGLHGERFHLIHHLFPGVPFWRMEDAHRILLDDPEYARLNARFGGIFLSSTPAPSLWRRLVDRPEPAHAA